MKPLLHQPKKLQCRIILRCFIFTPLFSEIYILAYMTYWRPVQNCFFLSLSISPPRCSSLECCYPNQSAIYQLFKFTPQINLLLSQSDTLLNVDKNVNSNSHISTGLHSSSSNCLQTHTKRIFIRQPQLNFFFLKDFNK